MTKMNLKLSPGVAPGWNYYVWSSTHFTLPLNQWTPVATINFESLGNFVFTSAINPAQPQRFYLLQIP